DGHVLCQSVYGSTASRESPQTGETAGESGVRYSGRAGPGDRGGEAEDHGAQHRQTDRRAEAVRGGLQLGHLRYTIAVVVRRGGGLTITPRFFPQQRLSS